MSYSFSYYLCDSERVPGAGSLSLGSLEPTLITNLHLKDVKISLGDSGSNKMMATTLITIRSSGNDLKFVVFLAVLVSSFLDVEDGGSSDLTRGETSLRASIALVEGSLVTEKVSIVLEELVRGIEVIN